MMINLIKDAGIFHFVKNEISKNESIIVSVIVSVIVAAVFTVLKIPIVNLYYWAFHRDEMRNIMKIKGLHEVHIKSKTLNILKHLERQNKIKITDSYDVVPGRESIDIIVYNR